MTGTRPALADVLADARLVVTCGPGGVGKTTTAATLALCAARAGRRSIVVTVDPARRLADALGLDASTDASEPHRVTGLDLPDGGELWALMLDAETTFDRMITENSASADDAAAILRNPMYRSIAGSLGGAQEYMAIERLHQLATGSDYDLIVVDTPPSRHAIDLLQAPERLTTFFGHPVYRALTLPSRSFARVTNAASSAFVWAVRRLAGPSIVEDTIAFFRSLSGIESGLRERAAEVGRMLRAPHTAFVLVSSPRSAAIDEATHLAAALDDGGFPLRAVVVNLVHPLPDALRRDLDLIDVGPLADQLAFHHDLAALAEAERNELRVLEDLAGASAFVLVPVLDDDVHDLDGLTTLAGFLTE